MMTSHVFVTSVWNTRAWSRLRISKVFALIARIQSQAHDAPWPTMHCVYPSVCWSVSHWTAQKGTTENPVPGFVSPTQACHRCCSTGASSCGSALGVTTPGDYLASYSGFSSVIALAVSIFRHLHYDYIGNSTCTSSVATSPRLLMSASDAYWQALPRQALHLQLPHHQSPPLQAQYQGYPPWMPDCTLHSNRIIRRLMYISDVAFNFVLLRCNCGPVYPKYQQIACIAVLAETSPLYDVSSQIDLTPLLLSSQVTLWK